MALTKTHAAQKVTPKENIEYDHGSPSAARTWPAMTLEAPIWTVAQSAAAQENADPTWHRLAHTHGQRWAMVDRSQRRYEYALNRMVYRVNAEPQKTDFGFSSWPAKMS